MRFYLYLIFLLLCVGPSYGAIKLPVAVKHAKTVLKLDSSAVNVRHFDKKALDTYSKKPEFQYQEEASPDVSWWTRFWRWFWNWLSHLFKPVAKSATPFWIIFWRVVGWILLAAGVAALIFLIFKAQGINLLNILRKKSASAPVPYSEYFEDINTINFDDEIENAVSKTNYRLAVRLLYLKCLKRLSDAELIDWQIDKTNSAYVNELNNKEQKAAFGILTRQFEYVWYGEFLIDKQIYKNINSSFTEFNKRVA